MQDTIHSIQALDILHDFQNTSIALSGGVDSVVLLHLAIQALGSERISAIHINHNSRPDSPLDALWCQQLALQLGIPFACSSISPHKSGFQADARSRRYAMIQHLMAQLGSSTLLTAHHADDRIESAILRFARGSNASGMTRLRTFTHLWNIPLCRPLLHLTKAQLIHYANTHHLSWRNDPSNQHLTYTRNRIRHQVLPSLLQQHGLLPTLRSLDNLQNDASILEEASQNLIHASSLPYFDRRCTRLDRRWFDRASAPLQQRALYDLFVSLHLQPNAQHIQRILSPPHPLHQPVIIEIPGADVTLSPQFITIEPHPIRPKSTLPIPLSPHTFTTPLALPWLGFTISLHPSPPPHSPHQAVSLPALTQLPSPPFIDGSRLPATNSTLVRSILRQHNIPIEDRWRWPCLFIPSLDPQQPKPSCVLVLGLGSPLITYKTPPLFISLNIPASLKPHR